MANIPVKRLFLNTWVLLCLILLGGCADFRVDPAPVEGALSSALSGTGGQHRVREGETLYTIAWTYGKDVRELARLNHLSLPYDVTPGQVILIQKSQKRLKAEPKKVFEPSKASVPLKEVRKKTAHHPHRFEWPVQGKVIAGYSGSQLGGNQGIDISGNVGDPVRAAGAGKVVYRGEGIRGYGLLVIIKHQDNFLSAYAHNRKILVEEGALVKAGEVIAEMGGSGTDRVKLHFEIRKAGKPVDPREYLGSM